MLSDDERRSLDEIERSLEAEACESSAGEERRRDGRRVLAVMGGVSVALLLAGVAAAALAVFTATLLGWVFWRVVSQPSDAERIARFLLGGEPPTSGSDLVQREWVRRYLKRLSEAE